MGEDDELMALNREMVSREDARDGAWFDALLAPEFAMRRANMVHVDRPVFLAGVAGGAAADRAIDEPQVLHRSATTAFVVCTVTMAQADGTRKDFRNSRLFCRPGPEADWQLVGWVNEPA